MQNYIEYMIRLRIQSIRLWAVYTFMLYTHTHTTCAYVNHELPDVQAGFRKGRGTRDQIANIR